MKLIPAENAGLKPTTLYLVGMKNGEQLMPYCKVGITTVMRSRLIGLNSGSPFDLFVHTEFPFRRRESALSAEASILGALKDRSARGEWFHGTPDEIYPLASPFLVDRAPTLVERIRARAAAKISPMARHKRKPVLGVGVRTALAFKSTAESSSRLYK